MDIRTIFKVAILFVILAGADAYANGRGSSYGSYNNGTYISWGNAYTQHHYQSSRHTSYASYQQRRNSGSRYNNRSYSNYSSRRVNEVTVTGRRYPSPYSSNAVTMQHLVYFRGPSPTFNTGGGSTTGGNQSSRSDKETPQQCYNACIESFGAYYTTAKALSPFSVAGLLGSVGMSVAVEGGEDGLRRRGLRDIHDPDPSVRARGYSIIRAANFLARFNAISLYGGGVAAAMQYSMQVYCRSYKCSQATSKSRSHRTSKFNLTSKYRSHRASKYRYSRYRGR